MAKKVLGVEEQRKEFLIGCKAIFSAAKAFCDSPIEILGIDPSTSSTGFAKRKGDTVVTGNIAQSTWGFSRLIHIEKEIKKLLEDSRPFVAIEGYAMNARFGREKAGELGGIIRRLLYFKKRPLLVISPLTIKAWVKAKGKDTVMLEILDRYKIKISNNDAADAFIIQEICHKAVLLSMAVVKKKVSSPEKIRIFLKNKEYQEIEDGLKDLHRYQETSLFRLIFSHGREVKFFSKIKGGEELSI